MAKEQGDNQPLTLGEFIGMLETRPADQRVSFDFGGLTPTKPDSYRGYYDHLAFGYGEDAVTVADVLAWCRAAVGKTYEGYKGGDFTMGLHTPLWVAEYGRSNSTAVLGLEPCDYWCVIRTGYCEDWDGGMERATQILARAFARTKSEAHS